MPKRYSRAHRSRERFQTDPGRLAIVAGWYDVVCFKQYKCYANMMTGNTLNLCMKIGNGERADVALISAAIANFIGMDQIMLVLRP
jgi:uncharacterized membrane protein YoaK (UPF0700 family)